MSNSKDIIVKLRLLVKPPININNFYYKVTYTKFGHQNENGSHVSPKTINNTLVKFTANPSANKNGLLAIDSEEIVLLEHSNSIKRISFPDAKKGSAWFQIENRSNGKVVKKNKYPEWSYRHEREVSAHKWDTTSAENSTTPDTKKTQQLKQKCPHTVDGAIEVAKYIVDEIKRNVRSLEAQRIRYHLTGEIGGKLNTEFTRLDTQMRKNPRQDYVKVHRTRNKIQAYRIWVDQVNTDKPWDHKNKIREKFKNVAVHRPLPSDQWSETFYHKHKEYDYYIDIWSNIHYGYVGRSVGFTEDELLTGSNIAQYVSNAVQRKISGDTTDDKTAIKIGIELYEKYNLSKNITASIVLTKITSQPNNKLPVSKVNHYCFR